MKSETGTEQSEGSMWIGPGTWLVDRRHYRRRIGVITEVQGRDRELGARLAIRWRPNVYQNVSVSIALDRFKRGDWGVDDAC